MSTLPSSSSVLTFLSGWPRRIAAALCLLAAALSFVTSAHRRPGAMAVVVAAHQVGAGVALRAVDVRLVRWPDGLAPPAAARSPDQVVGRRTAVALAAGTPVGDDTLLEPAMARALAAGRVATTVQLADAAELAIVRAGSYVDLYSNGDDSTDLVEGKSIAGADSSTRATAVLVLSVLAGNSSGAGNTNPTLVIAVTRATAATLSTHATATFVATLVAPP